MHFGGTYQQQQRRLAQRAGLHAHAARAGVGACREQQAHHLSAAPAGLPVVRGQRALQRRPVSFVAHVHARARLQKQLCSLQRARHVARMRNEHQRAAPAVEAAVRVGSQRQELAQQPGGGHARVGVGPVEETGAEAVQRGHAVRVARRNVDSRRRVLGRKERQQLLAQRLLRAQLRRVVQHEHDCALYGPLRGRQRCSLGGGGAANRRQAQPRGHGGRLLRARRCRLAQSG